MNVQSVWLLAEQHGATIGLMDDENIIVGRIESDATHAADVRKREDVRHGVGAVVDGTEIGNVADETCLMGAAVGEQPDWVFGWANIIQHSARLKDGHGRLRVEQDPIVWEIEGRIGRRLDRSCENIPDLSEGHVGGTLVGIMASSLASETQYAVMCDTVTADNMSDLGERERRFIAGGGRRDDAFVLSVGWVVVVVDGVVPSVVERALVILKQSIGAGEVSGIIVDPHCKRV